MSVTRREVAIGLAALAACGPTSSAVDSERGDGGDSGVPLDTGDSATATDVVCEDDGLPAPTECRSTSPWGEGPYFRADVPERSELNVRGESGVRLVLQGRMLDAACVALAGVQVYCWHAGQDGLYDTDTSDANGYGYVTTGDDGTFCFDTLRPPSYGPPDAVMPAHLHFSFWKDGVRIFSTQLFFADDPALATSEAEEPEDLLVLPEDVGGVALLVQDFVLPA